jgi:hypothetical protein
MAIVNMYPDRFAVADRGFRRDPSSPVDGAINGRLFIYLKYPVLVSSKMLIVHRLAPHRNPLRQKRASVVGDGLIVCVVGF